MRNRAEVYIDFFKQFYALADKRCRDYVGTDKPHGQAASLEGLISFITEVNKLPGTKVVCDAGCGATTAVLCNEPNFEVLSFDPDKEYAEQVVKVVTAMGLKPPLLESSSSAPWDACFYDYGTRQRIPSMWNSLERTRRIFYVDDCHDLDVQKHARELAAVKAWKVVEVSHSLDEYGRFGLMLQWPWSLDVK